MILQNQRLLAEICDNTGALVRLMDKRSGMEFVNVLPETACMSWLATSETAS